MIRIRGAAGLSESRDVLQGPVVVTIGNFDGVHLGHQAILSEARERKRAVGGQLVAYTFCPHPQIALRPGADIPLLTTYEERAELLEGQGVDVLIEEPFSRQFSTMSAEEFFRQTLIQKLSAQAIVVGYDFAFGKERQGSLERLGELCRQSGAELTIVQPKRPGAGVEVVSSSRIRQELKSGRVDAACRLLGREFFYRGVVRKGDGRGRKIGYPTANLSSQAMDGKLVLPYGVYATIAVVGGDSVKKTSTAARMYPSVTNIGVRPTFASADADPTGFPAWVETHLLDADLDLYGTVLEVRFIARIREERRFSGIDALKTQIALDCESARKSLPSLT